MNYQITGGDDGYWYNISRVNPSLLTISGAASVVQSITSACVYVNVDGMESSYITALPYVLQDANGDEIPQSMLNRSSSSVSASVDVYPTKELPVSTELANVVTGQVADGYVISSVSIQPETITVAADGELLESLSALMIEPVSVEGASQSFAARTSVAALSDFRYVSNEQVYVNITITEETVSGWVDDVDVIFTGKGEGLSVTYQNESLRVYVTGPRSEVEQLQEAGLSVTVDLTGLTVGSYDLPIIFDQERYPDVTFQTEVETLAVTLTDMGTTG